MSDDSTETEIEASAEAEAPAAEVTEAVAAEADVPDVAGESAEAAEQYDAPAATATIVHDGPAVARVYICSKGHRTISLWQIPATCLRRVKGHVCGEVVVPLADAPADAKEKMLNPLKASKKAAKKS